MKATASKCQQMKAIESKRQQTPAKANKTPPEAWEQEKLFAWIRGNEERYPQLKLTYATLNGVRLSPQLAVKMHRQGNRRGVPDIVLPARSGNGEYSGLYLELKRLRGGRIESVNKIV